MLKMLPTKVVYAETMLCNEQMLMGDIMVGCMCVCVFGICGESASAILTSTSWGAVSSNGRRWRVNTHTHTHTQSSGGE